MFPSSCIGSACRVDRTIAAETNDIATWILAGGKLLGLPPTLSATHPQSATLTNASRMIASTSSFRSPELARAQTQVHESCQSADVRRRRRRETIERGQNAQLNRCACQAVLRTHRAVAGPLSQTSLPLPRLPSMLRGRTACDQSALAVPTPARAQYASVDRALPWAKRASMPRSTPSDVRPRGL